MPQRDNAQYQAPVARKKRKPLKAVLICLVALALVVALGFGAVTLYLNRLFQPGAGGVVDAQHFTPKQYQGDVINILFVGIYREPGTNYAEGLGLTDMILYANYDIKNNSLNLLQIPRDSYVGPGLSSDGKINSLLVTGADQDNPINNLVSVITDQYKLPVDRYISLDVEGLKHIVNAFGSLRVYVPKEMYYDGSYLPAGWQWLDGDAVEFFVRNRKGSGFERSDIDRLENQRYFYSALFRKFMNLTVQDIIHLLPLVEAYCQTDIKTTDLYDLAYSAMNLSAENVLFCRVPGATSSGDWQADPTGAGKTYFIVDPYGRGTEEDPGVANLLNQYFRTYGEPVPAEELNFPDVPIPSHVALYPAGVTQMASIQQEEGGSDIQVEPEI